MGKPSVSKQEPTTPPHKKGVKMRNPDHNRARMFTAKEADRVYTKQEVKEHFDRVGDMLRRDEPEIQDLEQVFSNLVFTR